MPRYVYRSFSTQKLYGFATRQTEDVNGQVTINGELCQTVNSDGSIARGVAGPSPTIYDAGAAYSPWERK